MKGVLVKEWLYGEWLVEEWLASLSSLRQLLIMEF